MNTSSSSPNTPPGLIIAATASGTGKTLITSGLISALKRRGLRVGTMKVGPDYIDPGFHAFAAGRDCFSLDSWAMRDDTLSSILDVAETDADIIICEGVMGLYDGAPGGRGSTADIAKRTGWPVILVHAPQGQAASAAAVLKGFAVADPDVKIAGAVFNKVASERHWSLIREACETYVPDIPVLGWIPRTDAVSVPSRHLGLLQASETENLEDLMDYAADEVERAVDVQALLTAAALRRTATVSPDRSPPIKPFGQRIAVARDVAFAFCYPHILKGWAAAGAEITTFSPLADETPSEDCNAVYLPGGYPELFAGVLATNPGFLDGLRKAATRGVPIFGECGGYMVLGDVLIDAQGTSHAMAGLLPVETSFADRKLHLGYRQMETVADGPLAKAGVSFRGHEFHYASIVSEASAEPLFHCQDGHGVDQGFAGLVRGTVAGSFMHVIDTQ